MYLKAVDLHHCSFFVHSGEDQAASRFVDLQRCDWSNVQFLTKLFGDNDSTEVVDFDNHGDYVSKSQRNWQGASGGAVTVESD